MNFKVLSLILVLILPCSAQAVENWLDKTIEDLIYEKIEEKRIVIEIQYSSLDKLDKIEARRNEISNIVLSSFDPVRLNFRARVNYTTGGTDEVAGNYIQFVEVPITSKVIKAGEIINSSDITLSKVKLGRMRDNNLISENDVVGMQAKKHISAGMLLKSSDLIKPPVIKLNDPVNIVYSSSRIKLKTSGIAMGSGAVGDMIKVRNEDTGTILLGQIVNKNSVQVGSE
jgi:flagella basal body P-ring formation protein FlgA